MASAASAGSLVILSPLLPSCRPTTTHVAASASVPVERPELHAAAPPADSSQSCGPAPNVPLTLPSARRHCHVPSPSWSYRGWSLGQQVTPYHPSTHGSPRSQPVSAVGCAIVQPSLSSSPSTPSTTAPPVLV